MGKNKHSPLIQFSEHSRVIKAVWNKKMLHIFCDICIQAIQMGLRPGTHFSKEGWKYVVEQFQKESGQKFDKKQLKNKWDGTKKDWKIWKALIGKETGLDWDPKKQTVDASDAWWDEKIKAIPAASKFRCSGIESDLCAKYDIMFMGATATGESALMPSAGVLPDNEDDENDDDDDDDDDDAPSDNNVVPFEGSGDSKDKSNLVESAEQRMVDPNVSSPRPTLCTQTILDIDALQLERQGIERKQKRIDESGVEADAVKKFKRQLEGLEKLSKQINRLVATVESRSSVTSKRTDSPGCSIPEVLADLHSMPEVMKGSELHLFATDLFLSRARREVYISLGEAEVKLTWLKYQFAKYKANV